jgi:hypothetical protein
LIQDRLLAISQQQAEREVRPQLKWSCSATVMLRAKCPKSQ